MSSDWLSMFYRWWHRSPRGNRICMPRLEV